jgi:ATP-dependent Clp protease ATP-binding subunit ClpA
MFERFTDRARLTVVHAQDEARELQHNYIGTEHVLLGLLDEPGGVAAVALSRFGLDRAVARADVVQIIGPGKKEPSGKIPFTPRAKKTLELSLREALQLGHNYIGTEHILLGLIREGDGVAAQILKKHSGDDLAAVRQAVLDVLPPESEGQGRRWLRRRRAVTGPLRLQSAESGDLRTTPAADASLAEAARLAGADPVGSHHMLLAAISDPQTAAARALTSLGVDLDRARAVLRHVDLTGSSDELPEEAGRRQMLIRVSDDRLTIEATESEIVKLGQAALDAVRARPAAAGGPEAEGGQQQPDVIRGDQPFSASLAMVWQALHDALQDIQGRAAAAARDAQAASDAPAAGPAAPAESDSPPGTETAGG